MPTGAIFTSALAFNVDEWETAQIMESHPNRFPNLYALMMQACYIHQGCRSFFRFPKGKQRQWSKHKLLLDPNRAGKPCSSEAAVSARVLTEVLLMVIFSVIKLWSLPDFSCDGTKTALCQYLSRNMMESH